MELLGFDVAERRLAVDIRQVREIHRMVAIRPLADAPPGVSGIVEHSNQRVPVYDLRSLLDLPERPLRLRDRLIFIESPNHMLALHVDDVSDVFEIEETAPPADADTPAIATLPDGTAWVCAAELFLDNHARQQLETSLAAESG
ncbi:MAG: chemotaxis protein CheW [Myxococcota bacterium]